MALSVKITNDCKTIIVGVTAGSSSGKEKVGTIKVTNGSNTYELTVSPGAVVSTKIATSLVGVENGVFYVEYLEDGITVFQSGVIGNCDVLCCLAKKVDKLLDCSADCTKCASELAEAQQIFLLMKSAETELSSMNGGLSNSLAVIDNAAKKYNKAVEICGGHCGCNC